MKVELPPLPVCGGREIGIFNKFMSENTKMDDRSRIKLAKLYKEKSDGIDIFPKLPSMIKSYEKTWERNSLIKLAKKQWA